MTTSTSVATTVDTRTVAELEAAVIAGDASITAEQLATARARQDHTPLPARTPEHRAQLAAEAARQGQIGKLRDDIESLADDRERLLTLAQQASDALRALFTAARAREDQLDALAGRAKALGINAMSHDDQVRDPSGIGWRREHAMAGPARIRLGDTAHRAADPRRLVARIVKDTFDRTGQRTDAFSLSNAGPPVAEQIDATVREVTAPRLYRMHVVRRLGQHQPGTIVELVHETARWARDKGYAIPQ